jgi:Lrp/AsnC family transcriptional regulator, leucine-responsive regulatory protein
MLESLTKITMVKTDKLDEKIINELIQNGKIQLRQLASKLNVSFVTVMNRIKRLEKEGVIQKYYAKIDYEKIGYGIHVLIEMRISKGKLIELERKIARKDNVYGVYDTTGEFDATIFAMFKTTRLLDDFLKEIQAYDFVERTNTKIILNTIKRSQVRL